jgi:hypothetical protein
VVKNTTRLSFGLKLQATRATNPKQLAAATDRLNAREVAVKSAIPPNPVATMVEVLGSTSGVRTTLATP